MPDGGHVDTRAIQAHLETAVKAVRDFAEVEGWTSWVQWLEQALDVARMEDPPQHYHQDLLLRSTPLEACRLLATASHAWAFGGMGWWNDQFPEKHTGPAFDSVTATLYEAVLAAILGASNAAATSAGTGD